MTFSRSAEVNINVLGAVRLVFKDGASSRKTSYVMTHACEVKKQIVLVFRFIVCFSVQMKQIHLIFEPKCDQNNIYFNKT